MDLPQMKNFIVGRKNDMFRLYIMQKTEKYIFLNLFFAAGFVYSNFFRKQNNFFPLRIYSFK